MSLGEQQQRSYPRLRHLLARKDVLAGLLFSAVALLGLWLSRDYPIGTALRMGTGYVPRLLCWILLGLGVVVLVQGLREAQAARVLAAGGSAWRPLVFVTAGLVIFGLTIERLALGFGIALTPANLFFALAGALIGTLIGVLPGIGPIATIAMLLPLTFHLEPTSGLIMLAGIFYGAQYGGSTTAILVNLPGETSSVVTCIDGHQMARQGRAGAA